MKKLAIFFGAALLAVACSDGKKAGESLDACGCAKESLNATKNEETIKICDESRKKDDKFEADYQKCLLAERAGLDTSKVSISAMDPEKGLNAPAAKDGVFSFVPGASSIKWLGKKVTGKHNGSVKVKSGNIEFANGEIKSGQIVIDMSSITVEDLEGDSKNDLEGHLKSEDFFNTSKFSDATFTFKSAKMMNKHQFEVTGDLSIKGISHEVTANIVAVPSGEKELNVNGGFQVDRTNYDIKFRSAKFFSDLGDKMIDDNFVITLDLKASK